MFAQGVTWDPSFLHYNPPLTSFIYTCIFMYTCVYIASLGCSSLGLLNSKVV